MPTRVALAGICGALVFATALADGVAQTSSLEEAEQLFADGRFEEAAELAEAQDSVAGRVLAAESLGAHALINFPRRDREPVFARAVLLTEEALARWPDSPELLVAAATALGRYGNAIGNRRAFDERIALRTKNMLERALEAAPGLPPALAGLGAWHARLASEGGWLASFLFGADRSRGLQLMEQAEPLAQEDPALLFELARAWRAAGDPSRARRLLDAALETGTPGVYADYYRARAGLLLDRL